MLQTHFWNRIFKSMAALWEAQPWKYHTISQRLNLHLAHRSKWEIIGAYQTIHYPRTQVFSLAAHWDLVPVQSCTRCKPEGSAGSGLMDIAWYHVLLCWRPPSHPAKRAQRSAGTLVSDLFFISLANYGAPLRGWQLLPGTSLALFCLLSLLYATTDPAICCAPVCSSRGGGYSWLSASPASETYVKSTHIHTQDHLLDYTLWHEALEFCALTGPIFCYEKALLQVLFTVIDGGVACDIAFGLYRLLLLCVRQLF